MDDLTRERYPAGRDVAKEATREPSPAPQSLSARHDQLARQRLLRRTGDEDPAEP